MAERKLVARRLSYFCNMQSSTNLDRFIFVLRRSREGNLIKRLRLVGVGWSGPSDLLADREINICRYCRWYDGISNLLCFGIWENVFEWDGGLASGSGLNCVENQCRICPFYFIKCLVYPSVSCALRHFFVLLNSHIVCTWTWTWTFSWNNFLS